VSAPARPLLRVVDDGGVDLLVLDSQHNRNALSIVLLEQLLEEVRRSAEGDGRALVLDHAGPVFCAGVDLRERQALGDRAPSHSTLLAQLLRALWAYPKPLLCRVAGAVRGGGLGFVACSDVVVASPAATFAYSEVRVGVAPALVSAVALAKVPLGALLPWLVTGEVFDAGTAHRIGLVTRVADDPELAPELDGIRRSGPDAVRTIKQLARRLTGADVDAAVRDVEALSSAIFATPEAREGMAAFAEHRPPAWAPATGAPR
jgi:enoyl-CoA hydratase/carnithine racemase